MYRAFPHLGYGVGLRTVHYPTIFEQWPKVDWFEIISENFMDSEGRPRRNLEKILTRYPVVMHGVSLSIGSTDPLNYGYLKKLKALAEWVNPPLISDHLCWTGNAHINTHDLLPVPYTEEALKHIISRIKQVQDFLGRRLVVENPSTYLEFKASEMPEWEFIARMAEGADCHLLLDVNNVYVTCYNHRLDAKTYMDAIPPERVAYVHLAGHENKGTHLVDTHEGTIIPEVWDLYRYLISRTGSVNTMVEWDTNIPEFPIVYAEVEKAKKIAAEGNTPNMMSPQYMPRNLSIKKEHFSTLLSTMQDAVLPMTTKRAETMAEKWIRAKSGFTPQEQLDVYIRGYRYRLSDICFDDFPVLRHYLGRKLFNLVVDDYISSYISTHYNIARYGLNLPKAIKAISLRKGINRAFAHELATLEAEMTVIFDLPETRALSQKNLQGLDEESFMALVIHPRAALKLFHFHFSVNDYFTAVKAGRKPPRLQHKQTYLAVYRHEDRIWRLDLEKEEYRLLRRLFGGITIGKALEQLVEKRGVKTEIVAKNLQRWFGKWINNHLLKA